MTPKSENRVRRLLSPTACLLVFVIAGCGASSPVRYYGLVPVETEALYRRSDDKAIAVGPVRMAEYLNRYQIVTREEGVAVSLAEFDRWTEPLAKAFQRTLTDNLAVLLGSDRVLDFPAQTTFDEGYKLPAQVTRFDTDASGLAVLELQWMLRDKTGDIVVPGNRARYTTQVSDPDNYAAVVEALSELVGAFSRDVAGALAELP